MFVDMGIDIFPNYLLLGLYHSYIQQLQHLKRCLFKCALNKHKALAKNAVIFFPSSSVSNCHLALMAGSFADSYHL